MDEVSEVTQAIAPDPVGDIALGHVQIVQPASLGHVQFAQNEATVASSTQDVSVNSTAEGHDPPKPFLEQPCVITQEMLLEWAKRAGVELGQPESCDKALKVLLPLVQNAQHVIELRDIVRARYPTGVIYVANLAKAWVIAKWQELQPASPNDKPPTMTYAQADDFARWLVEQPGFNNIVSITQPYGRDRDIWALCIRYGPGSDEWGHPLCVIIDSWEHFNNPTDWELARVREAIAYGRTLQQEVALPEREAVAV
jgi:hypothetical protein